MRAHDRSPAGALSDPTSAPLTAEHAARLHERLRSPSGRAVMRALADSGEVMSARSLAAVAYVSTTSARDHGFRAAALGYAVQGSRPSRGNGPPATTWQITERGRDFVIEALS